MISHSTGAAGVQEPPSGRQPDTGGIAIRFEIDEAVSGKRVQTIEPGEGRFRWGSRPWRVQKHDVEASAGQGCPDECIGAYDLHVVRAEGADRPFQGCRGTTLALDHDHRLRPSRGGLETERPRSCEEIETARAVDLDIQPAEQRLAHPIRSGTNSPRHREQPTAPAAGDDAHRALRGRTFHVGGSRTGPRPDCPPCIRARATIIRSLLFCP